MIPFGAGGREGRAGGGTVPGRSSGESSLRVVERRVFRFFVDMLNKVVITLYMLLLLMMLFLLILLLLL